MEIISSIYSLDELNIIINEIDGGIIMIPSFSLLYKNDFNYEEAIKLLKNNNKKIILALDKIYQPFEIDNVKEFILKYKDLNYIYFYITDLGVYEILKDLKIESRAIYNPYTMITNYLDLDTYNKLGFDALSLSLEITLNDLILCYEKTKAPLFEMVFGKRIMFYSKRELISLYGNKINKELKKEGYIKETGREDYYPIIENDNGTMIYRPYICSYLKYLNKLSFLKYAYFDSYNISFDIYKEILILTNKYLNNEIDIDKLNEEINKFNLNIEDGFIYNDSIYQKEEIKNA